MPGVGKTVLAGHVRAHLQEYRLDCAYCFFHYGNKSGQRLSRLLISLAYQTAYKTHTSVNYYNSLNVKEYSRIEMMHGQYGEQFFLMVSCRYKPSSKTYQTYADSSISKDTSATILGDSHS